MNAQANANANDLAEPLGTRRQTAKAGGYRSAALGQGGVDVEEQVSGITGVGEVGNHTVLCVFPPRRDGGCFGNELRDQFSIVVV